MLKYEELIPENGHIIAETACGHEGDINKLKQLIDCVAESGARIIKFQIFVPQERATEDHPEWQLFNSLALSKMEWQQANDYARKSKLSVFADIFGKDSFCIAKELDVDGYKIHSEDLLNSYFIAKVAAEKKILTIGVGGAHRIEIYNLLNFLKQHDLLKNVLLMPGVQTFPTPLEAHSIAEVSELIDKYADVYGIKVGFADHVSGDLEEAFILPLMALAKGASVIEKHVTVNRQQKWEDYQSALGKSDFKRFIGYVRKVAPLLGKIEGLNAHEISYRKNFKKTPVASQSFKAGHVLETQDVEYVKHAATQIPLSGIQIIGKTLKFAIGRSTLLRFSSFEDRVGGIIVARCTSTRLPNKAIRKIQGRESVALLIERIKRCQNLDSVILSTSTDSSDDILIDIAEREGIFSYRGSLDNLSLRFYETAKYYNLDHIVRITGDDILRDEVMIDKAVESHLYSSCDVTFTRNMPYGTNSEIFTLNVLETILEKVNVPNNTEYLEYFLGNDRYFSVNHVESDYEFSPDLRMTLDYEEDFVFFSRVFEHFYPYKQEFTLSGVLDWLKENPSVMAINKAKSLKYTKEDIDVSLNI